MDQYSGEDQQIIDITLPPNTNQSSSTNQNEPLNVVVIGATGATGKWLIRHLLLNTKINHVYAFVRSKGKIPNLSEIENLDSKLTEIVFSVETIQDKIQDLWPQVPIAGLFSALGSTIKQAGSKEKFYEIDFTTNYIVAKYAAEHSVGHYSLVSSIGANSQSNVFYTSTKGKLEDAVKELNFPRINIYQPGILGSANRPEFRCGEACAGFVLSYLCCCFNSCCLSKWREIPVETIAIAMVSQFFVQLPAVQAVRQHGHDSDRISTFEGSGVIIRMAEAAQEESSLSI